jgi:hypothetical protein
MKRQLSHTFNFLFINQNKKVKPLWQRRVCVALITLALSAARILLPFRGLWLWRPSKPQLIKFIIFIFLAVKFKAFSRFLPIFDQIQGFSGPGKNVWKFKAFSRFPGPVGTLHNAKWVPALTKKA